MTSSGEEATAARNLLSLSGSALRAAAFIAAAILVWAALGSAASAHAVLVSSVPADAAVLADNPGTIALSFNEPVAPVVMTLVRPGGELVRLEDVRTVGSTLWIALPTDLGSGTQSLSWRAVSEDGHPISGTLVFAIGSATTEAEAETGNILTVEGGALWLARLLVFLGLFFGVGGAAFRMLDVELPAGATSLVRTAMPVAAGSAVAVIGLQGVDLLGSSLAGLATAEPWRLGLTSPYGTTMLIALLALGLGMITLIARGWVAVRLAGAASLGAIGLAVTASGHASAADPQWLTKPALFLHVTTITWWVGALYPLVLLLRRDRRAAVPPLIRFSRAIPYAIAPLVASGILLAVIQLGPPGNAWLSPYGLVLAAKLTLLVLLFSIASWNRWVLTGPAAAGDPRALRHMRRGIVAEIVLIVLVLGLVSMWRFTPPPRALANERPPAATLQLADNRLEARVVIDPPRTGSADVHIELTTPDGQPVSPRSVELRLTPLDVELAPITRTALAGANGSWSVDQIAIPVAGAWEAQVSARLGDFDLVKLKGRVEIEAADGN